MTKNINYRKFLDEGVISILNEDQIWDIMDNAAKSRLQGAQELVIALYLTGARPAEILNIAKE